MEGRDFKEQSDLKKCKMVDPVAHPIVFIWVNCFSLHI